MPTGMANLLRVAKSGNHWTDNEIKAYNIEIVHQDAATFFERSDIPQPTVPPDFFTVAAEPNSALDPTAYKLFSYMRLATQPAAMEESAVSDFVVRLLAALGFAPRERLLRTKKDMSLLICGERKRTKTDVCITDGKGMILMLVQEDKRHFGNEDAEAQLIAEAIAAFNANNGRRVDMGLEPLPSKTVPGIVMRGTTPVFYRIPVTTSLATCVGGGAFPDSPTTVYVHVPNVVRREQLWSEGMIPLDNRWEIVYRFEAFKKFIN